MNIAEIFVGIGGLGLGANYKDGNSLFAIDKNKSSCLTLNANKDSGLSPFVKWNIFNQDIKTFDYSSFANRVDLLLGGPPCQPFSIGGLNLANDDHRDMFPEAVRAVRELSPKAFVFENVAGLGRARFANYFNHIRLQLRFPDVERKPQESGEDHYTRLRAEEAGGRYNGLSYDLHWQSINAADYGIPQRRERIFIVGFRSDLGTQWEFPRPTHSLEALVWSKFRKGDYCERHNLLQRDLSLELAEQNLIRTLSQEPDRLPWQTVRDVIGDIAPSCNQLSDHILIPGARSYRGHTGSSFDYPSKTIKAGVHGVPGGENMLKAVDGDVRYFTVRECARLQTFPDMMTFVGTWTQKIQQIGNAVPPRLAAKLLASVRDTLDIAASIAPSRKNKWFEKLVQLNEIDHDGRERRERATSI
ncbi:DNA cytosine methyltransferase [Rhizobium leguminosarum]|uniref:DNA cytosine methyltransferase n=1 Tax=Rhizobium leguminosarum TaxID=384 RepID=UPI003F951345